MLRHSFSIKPVLSLAMALLTAGVLMIGTAPTAHAANIIVNGNATSMMEVITSVR